MQTFIFQFFLKNKIVCTKNLINMDTLNVPKKIHRHSLKAVNQLSGGNVKKTIPLKQILDQVRYQMRDLVPVNQFEMTVQKSLHILSDLGLIKKSGKNSYTIGRAYGATLLEKSRPKLISKSKPPLKKSLKRNYAKDNDNPEDDFLTSSSHKRMRKNTTNFRNLGFNDQLPQFNLIATGNLQTIQPELFPSYERSYSDSLLMGGNFNIVPNVSSRPVNFEILHHHFNADYNLTPSPVPSWKFFERPPYFPVLETDDKDNTNDLPQVELEKNADALISNQSKDDMDTVGQKFSHLNISQDNSLQNSVNENGVSKEKNVSPSTAVKVESNSCQENPTTECSNQ
ncbi:uncharacterized protein LOC106093952 [Stomoxys calcitrans]|uniref:uncharacterized protein LOC106093952 n=1 Tax=Stomoxys calcitrans TaxID=35570 RepID=UPI0027E2FD00|nr:uncharacterized protein LOC106093952 [Stomoxys calcitrans]